MKKKNAGILSLDTFRNLCQVNKIKYHSFQQEVGNTMDAIVQYVVNNEIEMVYIGVNCYCGTHSEDNLIFNMFSGMKRFIVGTPAEYLKKNTVLVP